MKHGELIALLGDNPSDENVSLAMDWLAKRKTCTKPAHKMLEALLSKRQDRATLEKVGEWIKDKNWDTLCWAASTLQTFEIHDWLVDFANRNGTSEEASKLWSALLNNYKDRDVVKGATNWLLENQTQLGAVLVASYLLGPRVGAEVAEVARTLAAQFPEVFFVAKVIEHAGNEEVKEIGRSLLESCDPDLGSFLATALLKSDPESEWPQIEKWLRKCLKRRDPLRQLQELIEAAPLSVAPLIFEWLDAHPRIDNYDALLRPLLIFGASQEYLDLLWSWGRNRLKGRQAGVVMKLVTGDLFLTGKLKVPADALAFADRWVEENLDSEDSFVILTRLLRSQVTVNRVQLVRDWLTNHTEDQHGKMFRAISRHPKLTELKEEALIWAARHPDDPISQGIVLEWQAQSVELIGMTSTIDVKRADDRMLMNLVKLRHPDGIIFAKRRVTQRSLEFRYRMPAKHGAAPILVTLLETLPDDQEVIRAAELWLETENNCEFEKNICEHISEVQSAYEKVRNHQE